MHRNSGGAGPLVEERMKLSAAWIFLGNDRQHRPIETPYTVQLDREGESFCNVPYLDRNFRNARAAHFLILTHRVPCCVRTARVPRAAVI